MERRKAELSASRRGCVWRSRGLGSGTAINHCRENTLDRPRAKSDLTSLVTRWLVSGFWRWLLPHALQDPCPPHLSLFSGWGCSVPMARPQTNAGPAFDWQAAQAALHHHTYWQKAQQRVRVATGSPSRDTCPNPRGRADGQRQNAQGRRCQQRCWGAACASGEGRTDTCHPGVLWAPLKELRGE